MMYWVFEVLSFIALILAMGLNSLSIISYSYVPGLDIRLIVITMLCYFAYVYLFFVIIGSSFSEFSESIFGWSGLSAAQMRMFTMSILAIGCIFVHLPLGRYLNRKFEIDDD